MRLSRLLPPVCSATLFLARGLCGEEAGPATESADLPVPALAPPSHAQHPLSPQEEAILQRYDTNGDGKLDADELAAAHEGAQQQERGRGAIARPIYDGLLARFDRDHQGHLNAQEQQLALAFLARSRPRVYQLLQKRFDRNGDGRLDPDESAALFQYLSTLPPAGPANTVGPGRRGAPRTEGVGGGPPGQQLYQRLLAAFDREHKGSLSPAEQAEAVAYLEDNAPGVYDRVLRQFDENGDGKLDAAERATMFATLAALSAPPPAPAEQN